MLVVSFVLSICLVHKIACDKCLPCSCDCGHFTFSTTSPCLNCNRMNLATIPVFDRNLTNGVKTLILHYNGITTLPRGIFTNYTNLELLYLRNNNISSISREAFTRLRKLRILSLNGNRIQTLHPRIFQHQEMLEILYLHSNQINDISNKTFSGLRRLRKLSLDDNRLQTLHPHTFQHQEILEYLWLDGNQINDISNKTFSGLRKLRYLSLNDNRIQTLHPHIFQHQMLEILYLHSNQINEISNKTFSGLRKLRILILNDNRIQTLHPHIFQHQEMLEILYLHSNQINDISNKTFSGLRRLRKLSLNDNRIQTLYPHTFQHQEILEYLWLYGNQINDISNKTFSGLRRLRNLSLRNNRIQTLHPDIFQHQEMLEELYLYRNQINDVSNKTFSGLRRLKLLNLRDNQIQTLHPRTFQHQEKLEKLYLHRNQINDISDKTFSGLRRLKLLNLRDNQIQTLHPRTFQHQEKLEKLDLHGNRIQTLHPNSFLNQQMLEELWLDNNNISNILDNTWNGLVRLKVLELGYNHLQVIRREMFSNLLSLEHLNLDGNRILSIKQEALLGIRYLRYLDLENTGMNEIPDALWVPQFYDTAIDIRNNPFICSCKLRNDVNQLKFKVNKLQYSSSYFEKQCENITILCEEKRNFALGMIIDNNCYLNRLTSFYNIVDGDYISSGTCTEAQDPCNFYLRINLPGDIVVTNVTVKMQLLKLETANISIEVGDEISGRYERCNNFTLLPRSGVIFGDNECASAPVGRNAQIKVISNECPKYSAFKYYEVVVKGYDQNKYNLWSNWGEWSTCSTTCDNGQRTRMRRCNNATSLKCLLPNTNNQRSHIHEGKEICNLGPCFRAAYQWTIGGVSGFFILTVFGIIFWYRKFKMITYFDGLRPNPNFVMDPDRTLLEQIEDLPYDLHWEFPRYDVRFGSVIDEGHFGKVWLAKAKGIKAFNPRDKSDLSSRAKLAKLQDQRVHDYFTTVTEAWVLGDCDTTRHYEVAVKTLKECATPKHENDLANELKLLIYMGPHPNIVNILASCTIRGDLWVILEYCDHGCLKKFLSDQRQTFTPNWSKESVDISMEICFFDLLRICEQIAKGMMFLSSWRVVHRDISARNILVDANFNIKISDFGLAKSDGFVASPDDIMPIRWSAIESLLRNEYSLKSDMWSVGVLYWEIFSLGEVPYPGMSSKEVIHQLKEGYRMDPPKNCPPEIWAIVLDCWQTNPEFRPNAAELFEQLDEVKVTICAAPHGHYYGTSGGEYDQAGTVQGPSLKMILEGKENMGFDNDESIFPNLAAVQKGAEKMNGSGPSTVTYNKYRDLETDYLTSQNAVSNLNKKVYELEEKETKIKHIIETMDIHDKNIQMIKTILLVENTIESTVESNTEGNIEFIQMTDVQANGDPAKDTEEEEAVANTTC